jgi:hypothetical protein
MCDVLEKNNLTFIQSLGVYNEERHHVVLLLQLWKLKGIDFYLYRAGPTLSTSQCNLTEEVARNNTL